MSDQIFFNPDALVLSDHYAQTMDSHVLPWLEKHFRSQTIMGKGQKPLHCVRYDADAPRGTVLVMHGFTENTFKFSELIYSLLRNGWSVCAYDQRGHGYSWRDAGISDPSLTHVDDFDDYVHDMEKVVDGLLQAMPKPHVLLAHSMGGAVSALYMERHPDVFQHAVLCSPMIAPATGGMPACLTKLMCRCAITLGHGKKRIFVSKPYLGPEDFETSCATSKARFDWFDAVKAAKPEYQNNGPTYRWTLEAIKVTRAILAPGAVEKIKTPVQVYGAEDDNSVLSEPQRRFAGRLQSGHYELVHGTRHEIYRSDDDVLFAWWHGVLGFLTEA